VHQNYEPKGAANRGSKRLYDAPNHPQIKTRFDLQLRIGSRLVTGNSVLPLPPNSIISG